MEIALPSKAPAAMPERTLTALGPILGAMDFPEVKYTLLCTAKGAAFIATITRSADYHGSVLANVYWRPKIKIALIIRETEVTFDTTWKIRLSSGAELSHAQTPPYRARKYPIVLTKTIR